MRMRFRAALAAAAAALGLLAGSVAAAHAATGFDRCAKGRFCIFDGADGSGAMASYSTPQARLGAWDNRAESVYNRTGYPYACMYAQPDYEDGTAVEAELIGDFRGNLDAYANRLSSFRWATLERTCHGGPEYVRFGGNPDGGHGDPGPARTFSDLNGDGRADLLQRTFTGRLWYLPGDRTGRLVSGGWNAMTALTRHGDFSGDGREDLLARNGQGVLSLYAGDGKGGFAWRKTIGTGWNAMTVIQAVGDLSGDGRMDLLARNKQGVLSLYAGDGKGGFAWRKTIGTGWNGMRSFAGIGDLTLDRHDDVVISDIMGRLWLYPGNGHGGFTARKQLPGTNWLSYPTLIGIGDMLSDDNRPDMLAVKVSGSRRDLCLFAGRAGATLEDWGSISTVESGDLFR
jgi:Peptidase inhibitor family I36/FG-GAP-like repeat